MKHTTLLTWPLPAVLLSCALLMGGCGGDGTQNADITGDDNGTDVAADIGGQDFGSFDEGLPTDLPIVDTNDTSQPPLDTDGDTMPPDEVTDVPPETHPGDIGADLPEAGCIDDDTDGRGPGCPAGPDCAPSDGLRYEPRDLFVDSDMDGKGVGDAVSLCVGDAVPVGYSDVDGDCDDNDAAIFPGAPEIPDDGKANGCTGADMKAASATSGIFVVPGASDANSGDRANPVGSLGRAIALAVEFGVANIFVAQGTFNESIAFDQDRSIHGGYSSADWTRTTGFSRLTGTGAPTVTVMNAHVVFDSFEIFGTSDEIVVDAQAGASTIHMTNATGHFFNCRIGGASIEASAVTGGALSINGLNIIDSNAFLYKCRVGDGGPIVGIYGGRGVAAINLTTAAIRVNSGMLRMAGGVLSFGSELTIDGFHGQATGTVTTRGLIVTGGTAMVSGVDVSGGVTVNIDDTAEDGAVAGASGTADGCGVEVSDQGVLWIVNSVIGSGQVKAYAEVYAAGTADVPVTANSVAKVVAAPVSASGGRLVMAHCDLHTDRYSEATTDVYASFGEKTSSAETNVNLLRVMDGARAHVFNSGGYSQISSNDSALIVMEPLAGLTMLNSVWWDFEYDVCRVHDGTSCTIAAGGLDSLAGLAGCERAADNLIQDQLWGWWDSADPGSPLIDGGVDPATEGFGVFIDFANRARPLGAGWDIGAYEFTP